MSEKENKHLRSIRSFVKREGKLTKGQQQAIAQLWPRFGVDLGAELLVFDQLFNRSAPTVLEIGFGNGVSLADMAEASPQRNFFGIEVHSPGVGSLLVQVKKRELENVRVSRDDAVLVLDQQIADVSLDRVQIFFPDPWHKKRHHKRRLIQADFVRHLLTKLKPNGHLHIATDWQNYAEHCLAVLTENPELNNTANDYAAKPAYRPSTKYEERGRRLGHGVWDIVFTKVVVEESSKGNSA
jgi:tRNA (guanine-N7-)-methyltransferase